MDEWIAEGVFQQTDEEPFVDEQDEDEDGLYVRGRLRVSRLGMFYLPHQCDDWVIGDINKARQLRDDLDAAISLTSKIEK